MGKPGDTTVRMDGSDAIAGGAETLWLVAINEGTVQTHLLPEVGTVRIGRADHNELAIEHPTLSRDHAAIHRAQALEVEDLGSANGTRVRGSTIPPHRPMIIVPGEAIELGSITLLIVRSTEPLRSGRLWSNRYFEMRLEKRIERGRRDKSHPFSVVRVHVDEAFDDGAIDDVLERSGGRSDVVSIDAHNEYAILFDACDRSSAAQIVERIAEELGAKRGKARFGSATFPEDGMTKDELLEAAQNRALGSTASVTADEVVVASQSMRDVFDLIDRAARGTVSVLLLGETGVGKEVAAAKVHASSPRAMAPFVAINCAVLSETLLEAELFGHETGTKPGILESAHGGTVFLDEISELSPSTQAKLLRVIEQRQVVRIGALKPRPIDVRFVSATNRPLDEDLESGPVRRDLLFRLNGFAIAIPPLRERGEEIGPLALRFAERASRELGRTPPRITEPALELLERYRWPGNIRELKNVIERAVLLMLPNEEEIQPKHLPAEKLSSVPGDALIGLSLGRLLPTKNADSPEAIELARVLEECAGNQTRAAEKLGIARRTLMKRLDKYGFKRPRRRE